MSEFKLDKTTPLYYRKNIFTYGILSVLYVLQRLEESEEYEECQKIVEAIQEQEKALGIKLETRITKDLIGVIIDEYKRFNLTGKDVENHHSYYADLIITELEQILKEEHGSK
jgi:hypothetical protein